MFGIVNEVCGFIVTHKRINLYYGLRQGKKLHAVNFIIIPMLQIYLISYT